VRVASHLEANTYPMDDPRSATKTRVRSQRSQDFVSRRRRPALSRGSDGSGMKKSAKTADIDTIISVSTSLDFLKPRPSTALEKGVALLPHLNPATVMKETFTTLGNPAEMSADQLADVVIEGVKKLRHYVPYITALKKLFDAGERDSLNRLKAPIKGCHSWKDFCATMLDRQPQSIGEALRGTKRPKKLSAKIEPLQVTDEEFFKWEKEYDNGIRKTATNLLGHKGITPPDVVGALIGMSFPKPMAEAVVRIISGQPAVAPVEVVDAEFVDEPAPVPAANTATGATDKLSMTFYAIRYKATGFFVQTGPWLMMSDPEENKFYPVQSLSLAHQMDDDESYTPTRQLVDVVKSLNKQKAFRRLQLKPEHFELVRVRAEYFLEPLCMSFKAFNPAEHTTKATPPVVVTEVIHQRRGSIRGNGGRVNTYCGLSEAAKNKKRKFICRSGDKVTCPACLAAVEEFNNRE
jgi:hypothetical protein